MAKKNVFIVGLNDFNLTMLRHLRGAENYEFHGLLTPEEVYDTEVFPIADMIRRASEQLEAFDRSIDGLPGYMDFPVSTMLPILCEKFGTASVSLEALLKCEHKYWSRVVQQEAIPEHIPGFKAFDPFDDDALQKIGLGFPFFVKPIKSSGSRLGFRIDKPEDFAEAIARFREEINLIAEPFDYILDQAEMPADVRAGRRSLLRGRGDHRRTPVHRRGLRVRWRGRELRYRRLDPLSTGAEFLPLPVPVAPAEASAAADGEADRPHHEPCRLRQFGVQYRVFLGRTARQGVAA
ncbi:MAG: hypothetical protein U5K43_09080 [Halofilum sp. (in: g-proteobacteria)]|nr:hypothetical protein [Halofilum sp. (in: g-proteobacteria)]